MKLLAKILSSVAVVSMIAGCASNDSAYIPRIPPEVQAKLLDYEKLPDNKVFILAVDPGGNFAFAYESGQPTLKTAARIAVEKVDASRAANGIVGRPYVYALNDKVVWADMIRAAHKGPVEDERRAQGEEFEEMKDEGEVDEASIEEVAEADVEAMQE